MSEVIVRLYPVVIIFKMINMKKLNVLQMKGCFLKLNYSSKEKWNFM